MRVVFDAGVVFSGAGWRGEAHLCLLAMARRRVIAFATLQTLEELRLVAGQIGFKARHSPHTILDWYYGAVKMVTPVPLGKQRSRDVKDDPYLACALAAPAGLIVSRDRTCWCWVNPSALRSSRRRELLTRLARAG